jgi:hypothetical protein
VTFMGCNRDERIKPLRRENHNQEGTKSRYLRTRFLPGINMEFQKVVIIDEIWVHNR